MIGVNTSLQATTPADVVLLSRQVSWLAALVRFAVSYGDCVQQALAPSVYRARGVTPPT